MHGDDEAVEARRAPVTPRVAGTLLAIVSTAIAVIAAAFIANPLWGVPAAVVLAIACVGVLAGVLMLQRKDWADKTWPPGGRTREWTTKRARRQAFLYGVFLIVVSAAAMLGILLPDPSLASELGTEWLIVGVFFALGVAFVVAGLRPVPPTGATADRPEDDEFGADPDWVRLGRDGSTIGSPSWGIASVLSQPFSAPLFLFAFLPLVLDLGFWVAASVIVGIVVIALIAVIIFRRRAKSPWVRRDGSAIRARTRELPAIDITAASLFYTPWVPDAPRRSLSITFAAPGARRATVGLRTRGQLALSHAATSALAALIAQSSIELPRDKEDPRGRFSKTLYPTHLTKAEALAVVEYPPGDGELLPVGPQPPNHPPRGGVG